MKTSTLLIVLLVLTSFMSIGQNWTNITPTLGLAYRGVHFANEQVGYCVGEFGAVIRTADGGATWEEVGQNLNTSTWFEGVHCFSHDSVIVAADFEPYIYRTTDGGANWDSVMVYPGYTSGLNDLHFINSTTGFATGYEGKLFKTEDFGNSWSMIEDFGGTILLKMDFVSSSLAYLAAYSGLFKSTDGGDSWTMIPDPDMSIIRNVHFRNANHGIMTGWLAGSNEEVIAKTYDGGQTWDTNLVDIPAHYTGVHLVDSLNGFLIHSSGGSGTMWSEDGGYVWSEFQINQCSGLRWLHFPSDNVGYAVGHNGIVKYESVANAVADVKKDSETFELFPNPTTDVLNLRVNTKAKGQSVRIIDVFGKTVMKAQQFESNIDVLNLSPGIYIVELTTNRGVLAERFIVQR